VAEKLCQPVLECYDAEKNMSATPVRKHYDFETCTIDDLKTVNFEFTHKIDKTGICHGYGLYFDAYFRNGLEPDIVLKTGPEEPDTHWYQTRILFREPIGVTKH